jgi:acetyl esterase/lipase
LGLSSEPGRLAGRETGSKGSLLSPRVGVLAALLLVAFAVWIQARASDPKPLTPLAAGANGQLDIRYSDHSDRNLLDVYTPATDGPHPVIIWLHPGGWIRGDKAASIPIWDWTDRGYAVVAVNYRYALAPDTVVEGAEDAIAATRYVFEHHADFDFDVDRIGVFGFSAGGHLAAMVATTDLPVAAVAVAAAPTDFAPLLDPVDRFFDGRVGTDIAAWARTLLGCSDSADCENVAAKVSPSQLGAGTAPILVVHGDQDNIVAVAHATRYADHLMSRGADVEVVIVPGGGHSPHVELGGIDVFFDERLLDR